MILYLLKSTVCLGLLFLFYKWALEDVAMHKFKRAYLIFALILSILVPILPTGYTFIQSEAQEDVSPTVLHLIGEFTTEQSTLDIIALPSILNIIFGILILVSFVFLINAIRNITVLLNRAKGSENLLYKGSNLILVDEQVIPHTFLNKIYISKQDYKDGKIDDQLIAHEQAHANQKHSWDILFIELLICLFWFNPLLRLYKTAIQLNHEFLADEAVINQYDEVKKYQHLLLDVIKNNNQISLASSINFHLTKKRLDMMTTQSTARQKLVLQLCILPMILMLLVAFGRPVMAQVRQGEIEKEVEQKAKLDKDAYFKDAIFHYTTKDGKVMVKSYAALPDYVKDKIPPMPPLPPPPIGESRKSNIPTPLKKGTVVKLTEEGNIQIGNKGNFPPPPPPPKAPNMDHGSIQVPPPPPPPPPATIGEMAKKGAKIYLNGSLVKPEVAETICENMENMTLKLVDEDDGTQSIYIKTKD